ncbi:MAG: MiaB/RimO family radical SAM methylthiotransferase [bacterium]|nr:MiaB/RimO family radical SAM methylthiotransferase [bacterium]
MARIKFFTFGCKANQYDTQVFIELFSRFGYKYSEYEYDIAFINTCCVTKKAEKEVKKFIKRMIASRKDVWITGCLVEKDNLSILFPEARIFPRQALYKQAKSVDIIGISRFQGHTRAFVKIVDGCENFCSYCIVPYVRGKISSRPIVDIITEIKMLVENSYKEIVLTGIDLGAFGKDTGESIGDLIKEINSIAGLHRFRLSSIEVFYITDEILGILGECNKFCPSFHIPLQSGSDRILKLMKRPYSFNDYRARLEKIRDFFNEVTITTDVMVGFPGETESDFEKTIEAISECRFLKVHVFPFSQHKETQSASLPGKISECIKKERVRKIIHVADIISKEMKKEFIGRRCSVLIEDKLENFWLGYSQHYIPVLIDSSENINGYVVDVVPEKIIEKENVVYLLARSILP